MRRCLMDFVWNDYNELLIILEELMVKILSHLTEVS